MSMQFNEEYYLENNTDVADAVAAGDLDSGKQHWELFGTEEGRNPNAVFNTSYYLAANEDVAESGMNPLQHFLNFGAAEGRAPNASYAEVAEDFDGEEYLEANADVAEAVESGDFASGYEHWVKFGQFEDARPEATYNEGTPVSDAIGGETAPSDLTEALTSLATAETNVTAALTAAAETVNASEDTPLEGDALDTYVEQFDADQLETAITDAETAIDDAEAGVNTAQAALLTAQAETFAEASAAGGKQGGSATEVSAAASALINAEIVDGGDRLTDANVAQALADAQAEVNSDKDQYVIATSGLSATNATSASGNVVEVVEIYADSSTVTEVPASGVAASVDTAFAVASAGSAEYYDLEGNTFSATSSGLTDTATSIAKSDMTTAKALQTALITAESAVASDESANGSNAELLADLRTAITDYADNGGALSASAGDTTSLGALLSSVNTVLNEEDAEVQASAAESLVSDFGSLDASVSGGYAAKYDGLDEDDSAFDAINAAIDAIENRDQLVEEAGVAETQFGDTDTGGVLGAAETLENAREELSENVTDAEETLTDAQDALSDLNGAQSDYDSATTALEDAQQYFADNDLQEPVSLDGGITATADNDLFLFNGEESTLSGFGLEGNDQLFIGTDFSLAAIDSSVDLAADREGDAGVLEVFAQQDGNNTVLSFEGEAFAGNAQNLDDITEVTLTGVNADDLSLNADGFITVA